MTKSGRKSPYFINTGQFHNGFNIDRLGKFYAQCINKQFPSVNCLFGPAYKGIPLVVATAISLQREHSHIVDYSFNRKEIKNHGEKGMIIGRKPVLKDKLVIIDDVVTAGLSIEESIKFLKENGNPLISGVVIAVDRMEKNKEGEDVIKRLQDKYHLQIIPIVTIDEILIEIKRSKLVKDNEWENIQNHRRKFGVRLNVGSD